VAKWSEGSINAEGGINFCTAYSACGKCAHGYIDCFPGTHKTGCTNTPSAAEVKAAKLQELEKTLKQLLIKKKLAAMHKKGFNGGH
jgi:hypothetical protein